LFDKIASEKDAVSVEELVEFLQKAEHPALTMASVLG
jgi:CO dehydrogenase/acetyl-CoA synthase beta subunit